MTVHDGEEMAGLPDQTSCTGQAYTGANCSWYTTTNVYGVAGAAWNGARGYQIYSSGAVLAYARSSWNYYSTTGQIRIRFYFYPTALPVAGETINIVRLLNYSQTWDRVTVTMDSTGTVRVLSNAGNSWAPVTLYTSTMKLGAAVQWYRLELVVQTGSSTNNSKIGFGLTTGNSALTTTNSSSQMYYYTSTANLGSPSGIASVDVGKTVSSGATPTTALSYVVDDVVIDNNTFTNAPSSWLGPSVTLWQADVDPMAASSSMAINNAITQAVVFGADAFAAGSAMAIGPPLVSRSLTLAARATPALAVSGSMSRSVALLPAGAVGALVLAPLVSHAPALAAGAPAALALAIQRSESGVLVARAVPTLAISGSKATTGALLPMVVDASALVAAQTATPAPLNLSALSGMVVGEQGLQSDFFIVGATAQLVVHDLTTVPVVWAPRAVPGLTVQGSVSAARVLAMRGTPTLAVVGRAERDLVLPVHAAGGLAVGGYRTAFELLHMDAVAAVEFLGRTLGGILFYDNVGAVLLSKGGRAVLFPSGNGAEVLESGRRLATVLGGSAAVALLGGMYEVELLDNGNRLAAVVNGTGQAELLPGGMLAVITE